jgi:DnaJ-class molecular chaperone
MSETQIRCLICGGRGGWWSGEFRETCTGCKGSGWETDPAPYLVALVGDLQDHDGFTPEAIR